MKRRSLRRKRSWRFEPLEPRRLLTTAPVANDDTYSIDEDQTLAVGLSEIFNASFEGTTGAPIVATGDAWDYLDSIDNGVAAPAEDYPVDGSARDWKVEDFDTASSTVGPWESGDSPFEGGTIDGFSGLTTTTLDGIAGTNTVTTYLFRHTFSLTAGQAASTDLSFRTLADDGMIVYLNGDEAFRLNMDPDDYNPQGALTTETFTGNGNEDTYTTIPVDVVAQGLTLNTGDNTLAVEVHQTTSTSSDIGFDLEMSLGASDPLDGFNYADDVFGTNLPDYASGSRDEGGGFGGSAGLRVDVGGGWRWNRDPFSGGWTRTFDLPVAATVSVGLRYRLRFEASYENDEYGEAVLEIDGTRYGNGEADSLARFWGDGNGGSDDDTGWLEDTFNIALTAGQHTITVGAYNNKSTASSEITTTWFDDIVVTGPGGEAGVLANDTDAESDPLTAHLVEPPSHGAVDLSTSGSFVYAPEPNYHGTDSFVYLAFDGDQVSNEATVTINVTGANDAPVAHADTYTTIQDETLAISAALGVLANDVDVEDDPLTAQLVDDVDNGSLTLNPDGSFSYTPTPGFFGGDSFTYEPHDGTVPGNTVLVTLNVNQGNQPPEALDDQYTVDENQSLVVDKATAGTTSERVFFSDFNSGTLPVGFSGAGALTDVQGFDGIGHNGNTFSGDMLWNSSAGDPATQTILSLTDLPEHTSVDVDFLLAIIDSWDGTTTSPPASPDYFNVRVDGEVVFSETFNTANSVDQTYSPGESILVDGEHLGFQSADSFDVDSAYNMSREPTLQRIPHTASTLTVEWFAGGSGWEGENNESWAIDNVDIIVHNEAILVETGDAWRYLDDGSDQGTAWIAPTFNDGLWAQGPSQLGYGDGDEATTVGYGPDESNKYVTTYFRRTFSVEDAAATTSMTLELLSDDGAAVYLNGTEIVRDNLAVDAAFDDFTLVTGTDDVWLSFDVDPALLVEGDNTLAVEVHQVSGTSSDISFDLRLRRQLANIFGVLSNDSDPEQMPMTATLVDGPSHGALTFNSDGTFTYTPDFNYDGPDSFTYIASDGFDDSDEATAFITVIPGPNEIPVALDDGPYAADEDTPLVVDAAVGVLINDTDADLEPLESLLDQSPANGQVVLNLDGSFTYTPHENFFGTDTFTYVANDGNDDSPPATVTIQVAGNDDDPPLAVDDDYFAEVGQTLNVSAAAGVLANDDDPDQGGLTAELESDVSHGTLTLNPDGSFSYTPDPGFADVDSFTYRAIEGGVPSVATVTITVDARPVAVDDSYATNEDTTLVVTTDNDVLENDSDADGDPLTAILVDDVQHGTLTLLANGTFTYHPSPNYHGPDSFTYQAFDGDQLSPPATVSLDVVSVNDPPTVAADTYQAFQNETLVVSAGNGVLDNDADIDGPAALTAELVDDVTNGALTLNSDGSFTYEPAVDFVGIDTFTYLANDSLGGVGPVPVTIIVNPASQLVVINEIMYHPSSENDAEEFIELLNTGDAAVNLTGWRLDRGVDFTLPEVTLAPGEFLVVAADLAAFAAKYPGVTNVVGGWTGRLSNRGETVQLEDATGQQIDELTYYDQGDWAVRRPGPDDRGSTGWIWVSEHDGGGKSLELINPELSNRRADNWEASGPDQGTPGVANSVASTDTAPLIYDVEHAPAIPRSTDPVLVTAKVRDELETGVNVSVYYRSATLSPSPFSILTMVDTGQFGDLVAGDGVYTARLPARTDGTVMEFYVRASDQASQVRYYPGATNDAGTEFGANLLYQVDNSVDDVDQPYFRIVMTALEANEFENINRNSNAQMNATFVATDGSGTKVRYNAGMRVRGAGSRSRTPVGIRLNLPHDRLWNGVSELNLNTQYTWLQTLGSALFRAADLHAATATPVQVRLNGVNHANTGSPQYGSYVYVEVFGGEFLNRYLPNDSDGNLYKKVRPDTKWAWRDGDVGDYLDDGWGKQTNEEINDWSDLDQLLGIMNNVSGPTFYDQLAQVADIDQWVRWFAVMTLMNSRETSIANGADDDYQMYRGVVDPRFIFLPHDLDTIFGQGDTGTNPDTTIFPVIEDFANATMPVFDQFFEDPTIVASYYQALEELAATTFSSGWFDPFVNDLLGDWVPQGTIDDIVSYNNQRAAHVLSAIPSTLVVDHGLIEQDGYPRTTTSGTSSLSGTFDAADTRTLLVGDQTAVLQQKDGTWSLEDAPTETILGLGATWNYLDDGSDQGTAWRAAGFDDASWKTGPAQLGYGEGDEQTIVLYGPNPDNGDNDPDDKFTTTYFRTTFNATDVNEFTALTLRVRRDDGVAVYFNGTEVARDNLDAGAAYDTWANGSASDDGDDLIEFSVPVGLLQEGPNVFAAEIHQYYAGSSDISFDLALVGQRLAGAGAVTLLPGINRVPIVALDADGQQIERRTIDIHYDDSTVADVAGTLAANTTWAAAAGPFRVTGDLVVPAGVTLTIEPGTTVYFESDAGITVNGQLLAQGTEMRHIRLTRQPGSAATWNGLSLVDATAESQLDYVDMEFSSAGAQSILVQNSAATLDHMTWAGTTQTVLELDDASIAVRSSVFPDIVESEAIHGVGIPAGGQVVIQGNTFGTTTGYSDVIDFTGGKLPGPVLQVLDNVFLGGSDDGLDLDGTDAHIEGNIFMHFHQDVVRDSSSNAIATGTDGGNTSNLTVVRNIFFDNDHDVLLKDGAFMTAQNNTFVGATIASIHFDETNRDVDPGAGALLESNLFTGMAALFQNQFSTPPEVDPAITIHRSIVPAAFTALGTGNVDEDPRLADPPSDFALRPGSPALGSGANGADMGASVPAGVTVSGEPVSPTSQTTATLTVAGPGVTHYRYRVNTDPWSGATPIATPVTLTGLTDGDYTVYFLAQNSAGAWQDEADATASRSWTVDTITERLIISEVLAINNAAYEHEGTYPDVIELFNAGGTTIDLTDYSITDDTDTPLRFAFTGDPAPTLAPGEYLVLLADSQLTSGWHTGFALAGDGETVSLYRNGGTELVDQVEFGLQLDNLSVARHDDGAWGLAQPTIGAANVAARTGDASTLRINEWLVSSDRLFRDDFIELFNPDPLPVEISGMYITDNPVGDSQKHQLAPLSFVPGSSYPVLVPDGSLDAGAEHLDFQLDAFGEMIALFDADGTRIDWIMYGPQQADVSEGRLPDGDANIDTLSPPNPGLPNDTILTLPDPVAVLDNLRISEIMYHPHDGDEYEYVELTNIGAVPLEVTGTRFTNGITFTFPALTIAPGEYVVVVENLVAFEAKYGAGITPIGQYGGKLSNGGENVELTLPEPYAGRVLDFSYNDNWYPETDGPGYALEIVDAGQDVALWDESEGWYAGFAFGGTPGGPNGHPTPAVTVTPLTTTETMPALTGTVNDRTATVDVTIDGRHYQAINNVDGAWTLAADSINPPLSVGVYDVLATATNALGAANDATVDEVTIQPLTPATIAGRHIFYKDAPITDAAQHKQPLLPGGTATFANYTSYVKGLNGIYVDIDQLAGVPTNADFEFAAGNTGTSWASAVDDPVVTVTPGAGDDGSTRITLAWSDADAVKNQWLRVTVLATTNTGLPTADVFYFGNAIGDTGNTANNALVTAADVIAVRDHPRGSSNRAASNDPHDFNKDRLVDSVDALIARNSTTSPFSALRLIDAPAPLPPPESEAEAEANGASIVLSQPLASATNSSLHVELVDDAFAGALPLTGPQAPLAYHPASLLEKLARQRRPDTASSVEEPTDAAQFDALLEGWGKPGG